MEKQSKLYTYALTLVATLAGMSVISALFVWKFVPETKGKTLEKLERLWKK